jgi:hypothetical protein
LFGRFDADDNGALAMPGACRVAGLGIAAHHGLVADCALGSNRIAVRTPSPHRPAGPPRAGLESSPTASRRFPCWSYSQSSAA